MLRRSSWRPKAGPGTHDPRRPQNIHFMKNSIKGEVWVLGVDVKYNYVSENNADEFVLTELKFIFVAGNSFVTTFLCLKGSKKNKSCFFSLQEK